MGLLDRLGKLLNKDSTTNTEARFRDTEHFCERCLSIVQELRGGHAFKAGLSFKHYATIKQFQIAAESGCWFCSELWDRFTPEEKQIIVSAEDTVDYQGLLKGTGAFIEIRPDVGLYYTVSFSAHHPEELFDGFERRNSQKYSLQPVKRVKSIPKGSDISNNIPIRAPSTGSIQTVFLIEKWLEKCSSEHRQCRVSRSTTGASWYPTRLLALSDKRDFVRLIETAKTRPVGHYMTLSHRWPAMQPSSTSSTNYSSRTAEILVNTLPEAFRDAILTCQRLHVRYLWIDSLCIIQDDRDDWLKEASLMFKVYLHSYLNISAVAAPDSSKSMLVHRDLEYFEERTIWTPITGLEIGEQWNEYRIINEALYQDEIAQANLNRRGWVVQERLLAPRIVHFGRQEVFWECRETTASETHRNGLPFGGLSGLYPRFKNFDPEIYIREKEMIGDPDIRDYPAEVMPYKVWNSIVLKYCKTSLTKGEDKLIAIAGIARYIGETYLNGDRYVTGMWESKLESGLLWNAEKPASRPKEYRAPSFSWASIDGEINPGSLYPSDLLIRVLDWKFRYATDDVYGLVTAGYLTLKCPLRTLSLTRTSPAFYHFDLHINGGPATDFLVQLDEELQHFDPLSYAADENRLFCTPCEVSGLFGYVEVLLLELLDRDMAIYRRFGIATAIEPEAVENIRYPGPADRMLPVVSEEDGVHVIRLI